MQRTHTHTYILRTLLYKFVVVGARHIQMCMLTVSTPTSTCEWHAIIRTVTQALVEIIIQLEIKKNTRGEISVAD